MVGGRCTSFAKPKKTVKLAKVLRVLSSIFSFYSFIGIFRVGDTSVDPLPSQFAAIVLEGTDDS